MALRELVEGECGGPSPLIRLTSHFVKDIGLKEEGVRDIFGSSVDPFDAPNADQLVKQFLEETSSVHPQTFKMESLLQEMKEIDQNNHPMVPPPNHLSQEITSQDTAWANQYLQSGRNFTENQTDDIWNVHPSLRPSSSETHELGLGPKWAEEYLEHSIDQTNEESAVGPRQSTDTNSDFAYSKFMKFMRQEGDLPGHADQRIEEWTNEFKESLNSNKAAIGERTIDDAKILSGVDEQNAVAGSWVDEFAKNNPNEQDSANYESEFWHKLQNEWDKLSSSENVSSSHPWTTEYESFYDPFKEYKFNENNPMLSTNNPLEEGKKRLASGDLPGAVLCFEAAVKQDPKNSEIWLLLGKTQAENEQDPLAISALKQCLTLDPDNLTALLALAVSYTNESYQQQACLTLKDWLLKNEKYKHLKATKSTSESQSSIGVSTIMFSDMHEEVRDLFIQAARMQPYGTIDADVQCGLGVLFNLSSEYDKAADCFRAAVQARPEDPMLWNRLGAILANGQRSEEAIDAYHKALELSPGFIRARYNLGIACINLSAYKEAGEHLLTALNQQAAGKGASGERAPTRVMSDTIWSTLRLVVSLMHKYHLFEAIENRDLERLNKEFEME